ncbi:Sensors of blue-light using FAD [Pedobacter terrae]|uniref:Sensors of blue-light using FAD n=1 Tax=Pedobacter terrae TaxID=405671 RepID=A0A1G8B0J5_9SPHI|nr:BLUF domain-containing protein [Pedobacter terrae]SDH26553.1 Sensors of blue-light using FAD [Pedobacter terrae]
MPTGIFYLIYTSIASGLMSDQDLLFLLDQSRQNNTLLGLTGMLLYMEGRFITKTEGRFIQFLEGEEEQVLAMYSSICSDKRNKSILLLGAGFWLERSFPSWSMGFSPLNTDQYKNVANFFHLDDDTSLTRHLSDANEMANFLHSFYLINADAKGNEL